MAQALQCIIGRARAAIPSEATEQIAWADVSGPLPLSRPFVLGVAFHARAPVVVIGFQPMARPLMTLRLVMLRNQDAAIRVALKVDGVESLTTLSEVGDPLASSGAGRFFRRALDAHGALLRLLDVPRLVEATVGS